MIEYLTSDDINLLEEISHYPVKSLYNEVPKDLFGTERLIFNKDLNKKGLQPLRCLLSQRINEARQELRNYGEELDLFRTDGCLVLNDVFSEKDVVGNTLKVNERFVNLVRMTLGDDKIPTYKTLDIQNMPAYRGTDVQCDSHFDTFHPTCKVWVYLNDITIDHAPLHFAKGTHINNKKRLQFMYDLSCRLDRINEGDFRDFKHEFEEPAPILGPRFTTILVDVSGFHKRGNGKEGLYRLSARGNADRKNPFRSIHE